MKTKLMMVMMMLGATTLMSACGSEGVQTGMIAGVPAPVPGQKNDSTSPAQEPVFTLDNAVVKSVPTTMWYSMNDADTNHFEIMFTKEAEWPDHVTLILNMGDRKDVAVGSYDASSFKWSYQDGYSATTPVGDMNGTVRIDEVVFRPISTSDLCTEKVVGYVKGHISVSGNVTANVDCPKISGHHAMQIEGDFEFPIEHVMQCQID